MRAGLLRHRVSLQSLAQTTGAGGGFTEVWSHVGWRHVSITPLSGDELLNAQQIVEKSSHEVGGRTYAALESRNHRFQAAAPGRVTTLAAAIESVDATSITITSASHFPGAGDVSGGFDVRIEDEIMTVTAGHGTTTWTVTRGAHGTTAAVHASGAAVEMLRTLNIGSVQPVDFRPGEQRILCEEMT